MAFVQIDDFDCPYCEEKTMAELNMLTREYKCLKCGKIVEVNGKGDE